MPKHIQCTSCGTTHLSFESIGMKPINREDCVQCGGTDFELVE